MDKNKLVGGLEQFLDQAVTLGRVDRNDPPVVALYAVDPGIDEPQEK